MPPRRKPSLRPKAPAGPEPFVPDGAACLLGREAVCKALGIGVRKLHEMIAAGEYPRPVKIGKFSRWPVAEHNAAVAAIVRRQDHARGVQADRR